MHARAVKLKALVEVVRQIAKRCDNQLSDPKTAKRDYRQPVQRWRDITAEALRRGPDELLAEQEKGTRLYSGKRWSSSDSVY